MMRSKKQRGYMHMGTGAWVLLATVVAVGGWAVISGVLWVLAHIDVRWIS